MAGTTAQGPQQGEPSRQTDAHKRLVFEALQPVLSQLLLAASDETRTLQLLNQAHALLSRDIIVRAHLHTCLDYLLFPFVFLLESIAALRPPKQAAASPSSNVVVPAMRSGAAAERALQCLQIALQLSPLSDESQLVGLLTRFAALVNMGGGACGEDLMLCVLGALQAAVQTTSAAHGALFRAVVSGGHESLVVLGYLLHGLLAVSQHEIDRGSDGSKQLQAEALRTVKALLEAVDDGAAMAFFLPGIVSKCCLQLRTGPGAIKGTSGVMAPALQLLTAALVSVLADDQLPAEALAGAASEASAHATSAEDVLAALQALSVSRPGASDTVANAEAPRAAATSPSSSPEGAQNFTVKRDRAWLESVRSSLHTAFTAILPPLSKHQSVAVQAAVAEAACTLSERCRAALGPELQELLIRLVFTLARHAQPRVNAPCRALMFAERAGGGGRQLMAWSRHSALLDALRGDADAAMLRPESEVAAAADCLASAIEAARPADFVQDYVLNHVELERYVALFARAFQPDATTASLWMAGHTAATMRPAALQREPAPPAEQEQQPGAHTAPAAGGETVDLTPSAPGGSTPREALSPNATEQVSGDAAVVELVAEQAARQAGRAVPDFPQMPVGLKLIASQRAYAALAGVVRAFAQQCCLAQVLPGAEGRRGGVVALMASVRSALTRAMATAAPRARSRSHSGGGELPTWQADVTAHALVLCEVLKGFSEGLAKLADVEQVAAQAPAAAMQADSAAMDSGASAAPPQAGSGNGASEGPTGGGDDGLADWERAMAELQREADAAMARDFGATWAAAGFAVDEVAEPFELAAADAPPSEAPQSVLEAAPDTASPQAAAAPPAAEPSRPDADAANGLAPPDALRAAADAEAAFWRASAAGVAGIAKLLMQSDVVAAPADVSQAPGSSREAQAQNALMVRAALSFVGAVAACAAPLLRDSPALVRTVLLPVLQRMPDSSTLVSACAEDCVAALVSGLRCADTADMILQNIDFVVDGLSAQLRQPQLFPLAPQLLASLLGKAGVTAELLPAMAEPASAAISRLSIISRHEAPQHTQAFLRMLQPLMRAAAEEGARLNADSLTLAEEVNRRLALQRKAWLDAAEEAAADAQTNFSTTTHRSAGGRLPATADMTEMRAFFAEYHRSKAAAEAWANGQGEESEEDARGVGPNKVALSGEAWQLLETRRSRLHAAADLAAAACSAAAPLMLDEALENTVAAVQVVTDSLAALRQLTAAAERDESEVEPHLEAKDELAPTPPQVERLLPSVHVCWGFTLPGLQSRHPVRVELALSLLTHMARLSGDFLRRRFKHEALPLLRRLLSAPPLLTRAGQPALVERDDAGMGGGWAGDGGAAVVSVDDAVAPGAQYRWQTAALRALADMASDESGARVLARLEGELADLALPLVDRKHSAAVSEAAVAALKALARVDADAVWLLLFRALHASRALPDLVAPASMPGVALFPPVSRLASPLAPVKSDVAASCANVCRHLLEYVEGITPAWHAQVRAFPNIGAT